MCWNFCLGRGATRLKRVGKIPLSQQQHIELRKMFFAALQEKGNIWEYWRGWEHMGRGRASAGTGPPIQQAWAGKLVPTEPGRAWSTSCCYTSKPQAKCPFLLNAPRTDNPDPKNSMYVLGDFCPCQASGGQRAGVYGTQRAERTTRGLQRST